MSSDDLVRMSTQIAQFFEPYPSEEAVYHPDLRLPGRHRTSYLSHEYNQGHLPYVGRFSRHIGPGDNQKPIGIHIDPRIIGDKPLANKEMFHHWMPAVLYLDFLSLVNDGPGVIHLLPHLGPGGQHIQGGQVFGA